MVFVTFTVDPDYDTVDVFRQYSEIFTKGDHSRWKFVTGPKLDIYRLVVNGFGLYVKENVGETRLPGVEVAHSNRVVLVNEDGVPVGTFLGTQEPDMIRLRRILTGRQEFPKPGPALSITSADGSPLPIEFKAVPAGHDETEDDADDSDNVDKVNDTDEMPPTDESENDSADPALTHDTAKSDDPAAHNRKIEQQLPAWASPLPAVNAGLNTLAAFFFADRICCHQESAA